MRTLQATSTDSLHASPSYTEEMPSCTRRNLGELRLQTRLELDDEKRSEKVWEEDREKQKRKKSLKQTPLN